MSVNRLGRPYGILLDRSRPVGFTFEMEVTGGSRFILPDATKDAVKPITWLRPHFADEKGEDAIWIDSEAILLDSL